TTGSPRSPAPDKPMPRGSSPSSCRLRGRRYSGGMASRRPEADRRLGRLCVPPHEALDPAPRVGRGFRELRLLAVEEAVRGARICLGVMRHARFLAGLVDLPRRAGRDAPAGPSPNGLDRIGIAGRRVDGLGPVRPALEPEGPAVEA